MLHTEAGTEAGTESTFTNNASQVSAHFGVGLNGQIDQFVDLGDRAWANGILESGNRWGEVYHGARDGFTENPNHWTVSCETEDRSSGSTPVSNAEYSGVLSVVRLALHRYPSIKYLIGHNIVSPQTRPNCPGPRWRDSGRFQALADATGLIAL